MNLSKLHNGQPCLLAMPDNPTFKDIFTALPAGAALMRGLAHLPCQGWQDSLHRGISDCCFMLW